MSYPEYDTVRRVRVLVVGVGVGVGAVVGAVAVGVVDAEGRGVEGSLAGEAVVGVAEAAVAGGSTGGANAFEATNTAAPTRTTTAMVVAVTRRLREDMDE